MMIIHSCESCGHANYEHRPILNEHECSYSWCKVGRMGRHVFAPGPSHVVPTFRPDGTVIEEILEPGGKLIGAIAGIGVPMCSCDECVNVYNSVLVPF